MHGRSLAATLAALITLALPATASAATFTVTLGANSGPGSLREAILDANANPNGATRDQIVFASGVTAVTVSSALTITDPVLLDGGTTPPTLQGAGTAGIVVQGSAGGASQLESTRIRKLTLDGFSDGIQVHADFAQLADLGVQAGSDDGAVISADAANAFVVRTVLDGNAGDGVELAGTSATIGGPSQANTMIRNDGAGVRVLAGASGTVSQNLIGATALVAAGNGTGVVLGSAQVPVFANTVSGNLGDGIAVSACGLVTGNTVGLASDGTTLRGNAGNGILVSAPSCQIGGSLDDNGNTVSANGGDGIRVTANGATIQGNLIGTDAAGTALRGNGGDGIDVTGDAPTIGAASAAAANVIADSGGDGVRLAGADNAIVAGSSIHDNTGNGVSVGGVAGDVATLGTPGAGVNRIADNGAAGVTVTGAASARIRDDLITGNGGLGIDLGDDGATANDALDADSGPNSLQNFPVLTSVRRESGSLRVKGTIPVQDGLVQLDFYESTDCVAGVGEGAQLLGSINLAVAGAGNATFDQTIAADRPAGTDVTATATRNSETSEFSACAEVAESPATTVTLTPTSRSVLEGGSADFTVHRSGDTSGSADVSWSTHPGSATAPADYAVAGGTVHFANGDADEQISVAIADDADVEPDESFTVTLDDVTNETTTSEIGVPSTGTVTIRSQDQDVFVVTNGGDDPDAAIDGVCARAGGGCTLRAAIQEANGDAVPDRDTIVIDDSITNIQLGNTPTFPAVVEPLKLASETASARATIDGNDVAGLTIDAGAAQQTQIFDVNLLDAPLDVIGSDALLQDADVSGAAGAGVRFRSGSTGAVGGATGHGNRIFGNGSDGVLLEAGSSDVNVSHNRIGVDGANAGDGVRSSDAQAQVFDNTISGNAGAGLRLLACADVVTDNRIGTQADGTGAVPNGVGIVVAAAGCQIGGSGVGEGNTIAGNTGDGILVQAADAVVLGNTIRANGGAGVRSPGAGARLRGNSITANGGLGIDTGTAGVSGDAPQLAAVVRESGKLHVTGTITAATSGQYDLEFTTDAACDPSGSGEGATPIAFKSILVASPGTAPIDVVLDTDLPAGTIVSATATKSGQTSEFAACATVTEPGATVVTLTPASQSVLEGGTADFTVHRSGDTSGSADVSWSTHPGAATAPADYAVAGGTVHFAAGEADKPISVAVAEDSDAEPDESFTVTLDGVTNASDTEIGNPSTGTVTIRNQDNALFVVTNGGDDPDAAIDGVCARAGGGCTLRAAIQEANGDAVPDRDTIVIDDAITNIQLGSAFPSVVEPLILSGETASTRATIDGNDVAGLTINAGAAQQTQIFDVNLLDAPLDVVGSDVLLQDADVSGAGGAGVRFRSGSTGAVGGDAGHGNRIFGNGGDGVLLEAGSTDVNVSHNRIGIDGANAGDGVRSSDAQAQVFANTISGNAGAGLRLLACADVVTDNRIGTQEDGTGAVPNGVGVVVAAAGCQVGGSGADDGNTIAGNTGDGILVEAAGAVVLGNTISSNGGAGVRSPGAGAFLRGNSITANGGLGIDTGAAGVSGGAPQLSAVVRESGKLHVTGTVPAATAGQYDLEFTTDAACDPSGSGEGATPIAVKAIVVASPGTAPIDLVLDTDLPAGTIVSATATKSGQTSEFAACTAVTEPGSTPPPGGGGTTPPPGGGGTTPPPGGGTTPPPAAADPQSNVRSPRGRVKARKVKRIKGTAQDAARVDVAVIRIKDKRCYALTRKGRFKRKTGPGRCSPKTFFKANGTTTWSFKLKRRFPPGRYRIYSRATAADGSRETPPDKARARLRR